MSGISMTEEDRRMLTEWLGECWHDGRIIFERIPNPESTVECCNRHITFREFDLNHQNLRTFTTWEDFGACFNRLVELGKWDELDYYGWVKWISIKENTHYVKWILSKTESGHYRLCVLLAEWLKEVGNETHII